MVQTRLDAKGLRDSRGRSEQPRLKLGWDWFKEEQTYALSGCLW